MPNSPKALKNISPKRTITTNRANTNRANTNRANTNRANTNTNKANHPAPKAKVAIVPKPIAKPAVKPLVAKTSPIPSNVKGVVLLGPEKNTQIKKIKPEPTVPQPVAVGGAKKKAIFKTAFRKPVNETSDAPAYTQLRTDRPPVCYYAKQGPRDYMEDTYQIMHFEIQAGGTGSKKNGTFYGVFDGHGGKDVSYECVHMTRGIFPFLIEKIKKHGVRNIPQLIKAAFLEYDKILFKRDLNAGSTAVVVLLFDGKMFLINLGDSRGMIFTKDELIAVSDDHKPQKPRERSRIYKAGHFVNPFRIFYQRTTGKRFAIGDVYADQDAGKQYIYLNGNWEPITAEELKQIEEMTKDANEDTTRVSNSLALSRALGDFYLKVDGAGKYMGPSAAVSMIPDVTEIDLNKYRGQEIYIFLASDGFWDVNRNTTNLRKVMTEHTEPQKLCQEMVDSSYEKGSQDNTTVVLDRIKV
jgi:serine/threonine protein phosphatase PrpC